MMANKDVAILKALDSAEPYLLPENALFADAGIRLAVPLSYTEFRQMLQRLEEKRRVICVETEDGKKWKITDNGKARLAELV